LVAKAGVWHLVAAVQDALRVYPLAWLSEVRLAEGHFQRSADFDLEAFWRGWCSEHEQGRASFPATVRVAPHFAAELLRRLGEQGRSAIAASTPDEHGRMTVQLRFESLEAARERILSFGGGVEVLEPPALRWSVQDFAAQIAARYAAAVRD
jgi:predicted DNA-binding transcriptional regulator YafY